MQRHVTVGVQIPLSGYGGISKLVLEQVNKGQSNNYWKTIGTPRISVTSLVKATVKNVGQRAAYVKCLGYNGMNAMHESCQHVVSVCN